MLELVRLIDCEQDQWNRHGIFTQEGLENAAVELALSNTE